MSSNLMSSLSADSISQLQHMGIDVYKKIEALDVSEFVWLPKVCELLNIETNDCQFDARVVKFDAESNTLHLPAKTHMQELDFKKLLWQNIQAFVK